MSQLLTLFAGSNQPRFRVDFTQGLIPVGWTFARTTVKWAHEPVTGRLTQVAINAPAFELDSAGKAAYLSESSQITNLVLHCDDLSDAYWTKSGYTVDSNRSIAPNGAMTMDGLIETAANVAHQCSHSAITISANAIYVWSVYGRAPLNRNKFQIWFRSNATPANQVIGTVDLGAGTCVGSVAGSSTTGTGYIQTVVTQDGTYFRVGVSGLLDAASTSADVLIDGLNDSGVTPYLGDITKGIEIYGTQFEKGPTTGAAFPTSLVITNASQVIRSADSLDRIATGTYNAVAGTLYAKFSTRGFTTAEFPSVFGAFNSGNSSDRLHLNVDGSANKRVTTIIRESVGPTQSSTVGVTNELANSAIVKACMSYRLNNLNLTTNKVKATPDTSQPMPAGIDTFKIGNVNGGNPSRSLLVSEVEYYDSEFTDGQRAGRT